MQDARRHRHDPCTEEQPHEELGDEEDGRERSTAEGSEVGQQRPIPAHLQPGDRLGEHEFEKDADGEDPDER